jgi:hypothetical protein
MGTKRLGNDCRVWIKSGGDYNIIDGNQDLSRNLTASLIDTTTKSDFPWGTKAPGMRDFTINAKFLPSLPDADGFDVLADIATDDATTTADIQIRQGGEAGADPADVLFEGDVYVTSWNDDMGQNAAHTHACTFAPAAAPRVYKLN